MWFLSPDGNLTDTGTKPLPRLLKLYTPNQTLCSNEKSLLFPWTPKWIFPFPNFEGLIISPPSCKSYPTSANQNPVFQSPGKIQSFLKLLLVSPLAQMTHTDSLLHGHCLINLQICKLVV